MLRHIARIPRHEARAALLSLVVGVLLLAIKFTAYYLTRSAAVFSDAMESIVNVLTSGVTLYALVVAHSPADHDHPYGHGKIEFLAAGFEGGMILLAAVLIAIQATDALLFHVGEIQALGLGVVLVAAAMLINGVVGLYLVRTGRRHHALALEADGRHLISDAVTSAAVVAALLIVKFTGWGRADPILALGFAAYIAWTGVGLLRRSAAGLMDRQDFADDRLLRQILDAHLAPAGKPPLACSYHKLRHRHSGRYHWVDFHLVVPGHLSIDAGHAIASAIEYEIEQALGEGNATAHVEPCSGRDGPCAHCAAGAGAAGNVP